MSDARVARRLRFVCENADAIREALTAVDETRLLDTLASARRPETELTRLEELLDLRHHPAWADGTRQPVSDFAGLVPAEPVVRLVCPHAGDCGRAVLWTHGGPPRCSLTGDDLRWDGDERLPH